MPSLHDDWVVLPHGPVEDIDDGIISVEGQIRMPLAMFPRRMTVIGLEDSRTIVFSPVSVAEQAMKRIEALGQPAFMVIPNAFHRLDARAWKKRFPEIRVLCPPGAKHRVEKAVPVDATTDIFKDDAAKFVIVEGTREAESALVVRRADRMTLIFNDIISNIRNPRGLGANILARLFGFGVKHPQMAREVRYLLVNDKHALAGQLRGWADCPDLRRIIVSHGDIIEEQPRDVLRAIALTLN